MPGKPGYRIQIDIKGDFYVADTVVDKITAVIAAYDSSLSVTKILSPDGVRHNALRYDVDYTEFMSNAGMTILDLALALRKMAVLVPTITPIDI